MREAAGSACAARPIAQMVCRVDMPQKPSSSAAKISDQSKARVNRLPAAQLLAESGRKNQAL